MLFRKRKYGLLRVRNYSFFHKVSSLHFYLKMFEPCCHCFQVVPVACYTDR